MSFSVPNQYRVRTGMYASDDSMTDCGAFFIPNRFERRGPPLKVIASNEGGWEHVSVSLPHRCPTWAEMCLIKDLFWSDDEAVMQLHPRRIDYVNHHPNCLHMWRPIEAELPLPPAEFVGIPGLETAR
jgi:hypothetical protein